MLIALREPVVRLLFERQAFDAAATQATAEVFLFYSPQLPFAAVDQLLIFAFYARRNTVTPVLIGVVGIGIYVSSGLLLIGPLAMGVNGLALANAIQTSLHAVILGYLLWRAVGSGAGAGAGRTIWHATLAATVAPTALCLAALGPLADVARTRTRGGTGRDGSGRRARSSSPGLAVLKAEEAREVWPIWSRARIGR